MVGIDTCAQLAGLVVRLPAQFIRCAPVAREMVEHVLHTPRHASGVNAGLGQLVRDVALARNAPEEAQQPPPAQHHPPVEKPARETPTELLHLEEAHEYVDVVCRVGQDEQDGFVVGDFFQP